ncbi:hypothetical protein [Enterobacter mori]|uniref:hypothetical protein n=1 Tax=Enterobacter mori TaxID=539813 RepID=UPI003B83F2EA
MKPRFKPGSNAPDIVAPVYVAIQNDDTATLTEIVVSHDSGGQPLSYLMDDIWDFRAYVLTKSGNSQAEALWNWRPFPREFSLPIKRLMYLNLFETQRTTNEGIAGMSGRFRAWSGLTQICVQCNIHSVSALSQPEIQRKLLEAISVRRLTSTRVKHLLSGISLAHRYGFIRFPIASITKLAKQLCDSGKKTQQTLAIPQSLATQIYACAIHRTEEWHAVRHELASFFERCLTTAEQTENQNVPRDLPDNLVSQTYQHAGSKPVTALYNDIMAACGTVIGAVSGMRNGEWYELDAGSYQEQTFKNITHCLLVGKTSKLNQGVPVRHAWVTAPVAKQAIELLTAVSGPRRARLLEQARVLRQSGKHQAADKLATYAECLFLALGIHGQGIVVTKSSIKNALNRLVASAPDKNGTPGAYLREEHLPEFKALNPHRVHNVPLNKLWPVATHQFRRTFAVFLLRNGFGSFVQIKQQLAHLNLSMSIWYGRNADVAMTLDMEQDPEIQAELAEMNALLMTNIAEKIYLTDEPLSGKAGIQIRKQIAQGNIVFSCREEIEAAIRNGELTIVDNGHSLCLNPSCGRLECTIDPVINPAMCSHDVIMHQHALLRVAMRERLIHRHKNAVMQNLNQPNLLAKTLTGIRACEKVMTEHGISFAPYGALIEIKMAGDV